MVIDFSTHVNGRKCGEHGKIRDGEPLTRHPFTLRQIMFQCMEFLVENCQRFLRWLDDGGVVVERNLTRKKALIKTTFEVTAAFDSWTHANFSHDTKQFKVKAEHLVDACQDARVG